MNKFEFRKTIEGLLNAEIDGLSWDEKIAIIKSQIVKIGKSVDFDTSNKGKTWKDDELRVVLMTAPTKENCLLLARAFNRSYGSIEQIFRWAAEDQSSIDIKRPKDVFIKQIKCIAKEVGWRAT